MKGSADWLPSLWKETFEELLDDDNELDHGDQWTLNFNYTQGDTLTKEERKRGWKIFCHCAFGNLKCPSCRKVWSSAKVTVLFHYRLRGERGAVIMRPFGQACRSCHDGTYARPGFSEEEVERALLRLWAKIRKNCYGEMDDNDVGREQPHSTNYSKPHESDLCEACSQGICREKED
ncbi:hypothetical protein NQZ68_001847 [Dissostichus eleginoides]|nr:hypothetical protein NQZ68_001847 [Dissostichus eleginoides]